MSTPGTGHPYEDPPPPSTLNAYRSNRFPGNERKIPRKKPPRASPPVSKLVHQSPEPVKPKANPPTRLGRSDSLLDRVFTCLDGDVHVSNTDLGHGTESQPSRPTSLWRAGSASVVPKHVSELSSVTQANVPDVGLQLVAPVRGNVVGADGTPSQDKDSSIPPPQQLHIRNMAEHFVTPSHSPSLQQSPPVVDHPSIRHDLPANPLSRSHPPAIPESSAGHNIPFPIPPLRTEFGPQRHIPDQGGHADPRTVYPFPVTHPQLRPPLQQCTVAGPGSPSNLARPRRASRNEALLRPFPEPVHHPLPNMGPTKLTPPRSKLTIPAPLAQPLPRGSGSLKRNRTNTIPVPKQHTLSNEEPHRESRSRRRSQPIPVPCYTTGPNSMSHPPNSPSRNPHRRTSQPLPVLRETSHPYAGPPSSPSQRSSRRLSSPPLSALPPSRPIRSNAIHRKSPDSRSPTRATNPHMSLLAELKSAAPMDSDNLSRYPISGPGSGIGSPPRMSRKRPPPSPRTPPFVNTHMLPSPTSSPRSDAEE